jgi:hypothetical protein
VELLARKAQTSADGRLVGIYLPAAKTQDGKGGWVQMPAAIAPQRAVLGPRGEQNLSIAYDGKVCTVLLPLTAVRNVEALVLREDIPAHRDATLDQNFNPAE